MNLKNIEEQKAFLKRNLEKINTVVTALIGVRTHFEIIEKVTFRETYLILADNNNFAQHCGVMRHAWKNVIIDTFNIWWNEDGCELVMHFSYEHINGGHNGAEFCRLEVFDDFVAIK